MISKNKPTTIIIGFIITALCWTCSDYHAEAQPQIGDTLVVAYQQTIRYPAESVSISFDSLASDSRCPIGAQCKWAGDAELIFTFSAGSKQVEISLHSYLSPGDTTVLGYNIELIDVNPYPHIGSTYVPYDYSATIYISSWD